MDSAAYLLAVGVFMLCCCGSGDHMTEPPAPEPAIPEPSVPDPSIPELPKGPKWKLVGIADVETGVLEEVIPRKGVVVMVNGWLKLIDGEPVDCEKCYTLTFVTDSTAHGWSLMNELHVSFFEPIQISSTNISFSGKPACGATKIGEPPIPTRYIDALRDLTSYVYYDNELKLFCNSNQNYLLYKLVEQ